MIALRHRTLSAAASIAVALSAFSSATEAAAQLSAPQTTSAVPSWQANDDDFLLLQLDDDWKVDLKLLVVRDNCLITQW